MVCMLTQNILGALDHAVAFSNHVGLSRNISQVIILHTVGLVCYAVFLVMRLCEF